MYALGSRGESSFHAALALPSPPPADWGAALTTREIGKAPEDNPEQWFPADIVAGWFRECGFEIEDFKAKTAAQALLNAHGPLLGRALFEWKMQDDALGDRDHAGPTAALRSRLRSVANTAERLQADLSDIRGELLLLRAKGQQTSELESLHQSLHGVFHKGLLRRQRAFRCSQPNDELDWSIEVGPHASTMPTFLEQGLEQLSKAARSTAVAKSPASMPSEHSIKTIRDQFIRDVAQIWVTTTSTRPSVGTWYNRRGERRCSAFKTFYEIVGGHVAGLIMRSGMIDWDGASNKKKDAIKARFHALGLIEISPSTLARRVRSVQFAPNPTGSL